MKFLESILDAVLARSPEELIGALLIAGAAAVVMAGLYGLGRRKATPSPTFVAGLVLTASLACMALTAGRVEYLRNNRASDTVGVIARSPRRPLRNPDGTPSRRTRGVYGPTSSFGFHVVLAADADRNGRLTREEVDNLVKDADDDGDGSVDFRDIDRLVSTRFASRSRRDGQVAPGRDDRRDEGGTPAAGPGPTPSHDEQPPPTDND